MYVIYRMNGYKRAYFAGYLTVLWFFPSLDWSYDEDMAIYFDTPGEAYELIDKEGLQDVAKVGRTLTKSSLAIA